MRLVRSGSAPGARGTGRRVNAEVVLLERLAFEGLLADLSARLFGFDNADVDLLDRTEHALECVAAFLHCDRCTFSEFVGGDYLNVLCSVGSDRYAALPRARFRFPFPWFVEELRRDRIVAVSNLPEDLPPEAVEEAAHCEREGLRSHLSIPVRINGRVTSVLSFAVLHETRSWPPAMVERLKIVADMIGSSVALARSEEETRQLRHRIWHADRVQRVGALTAAIAHEFNQPLAAILSNARAGLRYLSRDDAGSDAINGILEAVVREGKRAAETIRTMRALIRRDETRRECVDLGAAMGEAGRLLEGEFADKGVRVEYACESGCRVMADKVQLEQVGLNLLLNAAAALRDGARAPHPIELRVEHGAEGRVRMSVRDAGRGVAPADLESIFEPFWTTREEGLGLGLPICRSIVEAHNGRIWAESNAEGGATFNVELPAAPAAEAIAPGPDEAAQTEPMASSRPLTAAIEEQPLVCVIDDDPEVREGLLRLLGGEGWAAASFPAAEDFLARPPARSPACILLDVQMPGLSGPQLHRRLLETGSAPPVIFLTGRGDLAEGVEAMKRGAADFFEKPVDGEVLIAAVHRAIARQAGARLQARLQQAQRERLARLSPREREIMAHVVRGRLNKQIAFDLRIAEQTVKQHRGRVMEKMGVRSVADLVRAWETTREPAAIST